jgi:hypothetical protein
MRVNTFTEIEAEFIERAHRMVWCNVATVDASGRPRSRVVHTIWEGATGWAITRARSPKLSHLRGNPHVSLAYVSDLVYPVYADCMAGWEDDPAVKQHVWDLFSAAPPPLGFDPATMFGSATGTEFGVLRLAPYRISLENASGKGERRIVWRAPA